MFGLSEIHYMNSQVGSGRRNAMTKDQVADSYGVQRSAITRAANNSWAVKLDHGMAYVHIRTEVVRVYRSGAVKLCSGGWETVTTKDRINRFQYQGRIYSDRGRWVVRVYGGGLYAFRSGMVIERGKAFDTEGVELEPLAEPGTARGVRIGNLITEGIETWGALSGFWEGRRTDGSLSRITARLEAAGIDEIMAILAPHVHRLDDTTGQIDLDRFEKRVLDSATPDQD
jgi:hypothetical protein